MAFAFMAVAPALNTLLNQLNQLAPKRSRASDGALGDQAHAARKSFHNPNDAGVVQARDYTHDPAGGLDCNWLAAALTSSGDPRILEIIWNRRYWTPTGGWVPYYGSNPHDKHLHLTVRSEPKLYNSTAPWDLGRAVTPTTAPEDDMYGPKEHTDVVGRLDRVLGILDAIHPAIASMHVGLMDPASGVRTVVFQLAGREPVQVDAAELAALLGPMLGPALAEKTGLTEDDVKDAIREVLGGLDGVSA